LSLLLFQKFIKSKKPLKKYVGVLGFGLVDCLVWSELLVLVWLCDCWCFVWVLVLPALLEVKWSGKPLGIKAV
jgi:hypothetical protein